MRPNVSFFQRHPMMKDVISLVSFVACVIAGTLILNAFIFRSYNVVGVSMENTLHGDDRIIVNRLPVTAAHFLGQEYVPNRGDIIVFANGDADGPLTCGVKNGVKDQYIIKRVIAFPGERVTVKDGVLTVYNSEHPDGFSPDEDTRKSDTDGPKKYTSGEVDIVVPEGEIFVSGDNREGTHSYDSRNGLGTVPYCRIVGPALIRIYPFDSIRVF
ncbi:signal peptidase I [Candidatus Saccharibacteria bacterium]|nr:signal peptidase I [Candidatus Saccharibacteria bacterium]